MVTVSLLLLALGPPLFAADLEALWTADGPQQTSPFGQNAAAAGDVNADGYDDVLVGSYDCTHRGAVALYLGSAVGLPASPSFQYEARPRRGTPSTWLIGDDDSEDLAPPSGAAGT